MAAVQAIRPTAPEFSDTAAMLQACFDKQRAAYYNDPVPSLEQRKKDLHQLRAMLNENREAIIEAIKADYGTRSRHETLFTDIISTGGGIKDAIKNVDKWSKVQKRHVDVSLYAGSKNRVVPQPLGCVGIIVPWNFPVFLSFGPLTTALAAGNRVMVKMSENSRNLCRLLMDISPKYFPEETLQFFDETGDVGIEFSKIPFDLLFFTGSGATGKKVMAAAAENLTPVVLELGGKCPAIIDPEYPLSTAVQRILFAKQFNAGQICLTVDYVMVQEDLIDDFVGEACSWAAQHLKGVDSIDYTAVIDDRAFKRLEDTLADARKKGANIINLHGDQKPDAANRKMPVHLVLDTTPDMIIRNRETFGPLLVVLPYKTQQDVVRHIQQHDRPLGLYPFTNNKEVLSYYLTNTMSGGMSVNDALYHVAQHDLPFGGVGGSGMGHYHGKEGFETFSKLRPVFHQAPFSAMKLLQPPYGRFADKVYGLLVKLKT